MFWNVILALQDHLTNQDKRDKDISVLIGRMFSSTSNIESDATLFFSQVSRLVRDLSAYRRQHRESRLVTFFHFAFRVPSDTQANMVRMILQYIPILIHKRCDNPRKLAKN